jgi:hypothetical protein
MENLHLVADIINDVKAGKICPKGIAQIIYSMGNCLKDRHPDVYLWLSMPLEDTANMLFNAIDIAKEDDTVQA